MIEYIPNEPADFENTYENKSTGYQNAKEFEPISDEVYDSLFNTVLDEPLESANEYLPVKKYTRKNIN
jgi:hypothetical protein